MMKSMNIIETTVLADLKKLYTKKVSKFEVKTFDDIQYAELPVTYLAQRFGLTPYKQRIILEKLKKTSELTIRFGQGHTRYFAFNASAPMPCYTLKKEIQTLLNSTTDTEVLNRVIKVLRDRETATKKEQELEQRIDLLLLTRQKLLDELEATSTLLIEKNQEYDALMNSFIAYKNSLKGCK